MPRFRHYAGHGVGTKRPEAAVPSTNHFAKLSKEASAKIAEMGLVRVAGNVFELPSKNEFWRVSTDGNISRLTGGEVDLHESIQAAPKDEPADFLQGILADLEL
jgi:hypothetical protein